MSFARFEASHAPADSSADAGHLQHLLNAADFWSADVTSIQAGGGHAGKRIRTADANTDQMFHRGDMAAQDMLDDLGQRWTAAKAEDKPISKERMNQFVERAKELVSTSDGELAEGLPKFEKRYERIQPGIHAFKDYLTGVWNQITPLLGGLQTSDREKIEKLMNPDKLIWDMSHGTMLSLENTAIATKIAPFVKSLERRYGDSDLMFSEVDFLRRQVRSLKGQSTVSRELAEEIFTAADLKNDATRVNEENKKVYAISITDLGEMLTSLKSFVQKQSA